MAFDEAARAKALKVRRDKKALRDAEKQKQAQKPEIPQFVPSDVPRESQEAMAPESTEAGSHFVDNMVTPHPDKPETWPTNYLSGFVRRLEVHGDRPGFVRRWFNDDKGGSNIAAARASGWTFVERKDVQLNAAVTPRNTDLGSNVQECVGTNENGNPLFAYLMEIPQWLHEKHQEARMAYHNQLKAQIKAGTLGMRAGDGRYSAANPPPGGTTLKPITVDTKLYR